MLTKKQKREICEKIEGEGFDYYFIEYGEVSKYKDQQLNKLVKEYRNIRAKLSEYVGYNDYLNEL